MQVTHNQVDTSKGKVDIYTLTNNSGASLVLSSIGAGILEVNVPDSHGRIENVALRYADIESYFGDGPCMGKTPGRFANRIAHGRFSLDGREYTLDCNCGSHHLHGGNGGFHNRIWDSEIVGPGSVRFTLHSPDGEEGYPGNVEAQVTYIWSEDNCLDIEYQATADAPTPLSMTNHTYWNLRNATAGCALNHVLNLRAHHYLVTTPDLAPTGEVAHVGSTPMDFTTERTVGSQIEKPFHPLEYGKGYDSCWVLDRSTDEALEVAAELRCNITGRILTVSTTLPGIQVYSGNWLTGSPKGPEGYEYSDYDAVALECQQLPDAPNHPEFPNAILRPGQVSKQRIQYKFTTLDL